MCSPCPFLSVYSQEECLPENWKKLLPRCVRFLFVCFCPVVLSASVGLNSGYRAQSGSLGKAGSCVWRQGWGGKKVLFLQSCKSSTFCQCCIFFYCLFLRRYCCKSTGCKQNLVCSKFTTGQVMHFEHLWDTRKGNIERAFQKLQLEMQQFPCCLELQCQRDFYF